MKFFLTSSYDYFKDIRVDNFLSKQQLDSLTADWALYKDQIKLEEILIKVFPDSEFTTRYTIDLEYTSSFCLLRDLLGQILIIGRDITVLQEDGSELTLPELECTLKI